MENLTFETKCRKCGTILTYTDDGTKTDTAERFNEMINILKRDPMQFPCKKCGIFTVQDLVSYTRTENVQEPELTQSQKDLIEKCIK